MADSNSTPDVPENAKQSDSREPGVLQCLMGSVTAGAIATALYFLTHSIAQTFANKPIHSTKVIVLKLAIAVRTLVVGVSTLGTFVFGLAALGLFALAIQILLKGTQKSANS